MTDSPQLFTMVALLFNGEEEDDDEIIYNYIKHVKIAVAGHLLIAALTINISLDIDRTH